MKRVFTSGVIGLLIWNAQMSAQQVSDFERLDLAPNSFWDGSPSNEVPFVDGDAVFENKFQDGFWTSGFAYSNMKDTTTEGFGNMFSAIAGKGAENSKNFAVAEVFDTVTVKFKTAAYNKPLTGLYVTNSTYAYKSMQKGDMFGKKFGGPTGTDPDFFLLTINAYFQGVRKKEEVRFYLADFRSENAADDYIVNNWRWVDLSSLGEIDSLKFKLSSSDVGEFGMNTPAYFCFDMLNRPYFADKVGTLTSTAIFKDSTIIKSWAVAAEVSRGYKDIAVKDSGFVNYGQPQNALGQPDGQVVSLGDGGSAIIRFSNYISNDVGPDFAVFENGFSDTFLELAKVAVSSNGLDFFEFPAISNTNTLAQTSSFGATNPYLLNNLAGKYRANYGTPFDLSDLEGIEGLNLNRISHVKIIDVIGKVKGEVMKDINGNPINDPYPTNFGSGGFDLDAVAVINEGGVVSDLVDNEIVSGVQTYPNPVKEVLWASNLKDPVFLYGSTGMEIGQFTPRMDGTLRVDMAHLPTGFYWLKSGSQSVKILKD